MATASIDIHLIALSDDRLREIIREELYRAVVPTNVSLARNLESTAIND